MKLGQRTPTTQPDPPGYLPVEVANIPVQLHEHLQCVVWKSVWRPKEQRHTKVPYQPNGRRADVTDSTTWCTFAEAVAAYESGKYAGIGIVLTDDDPLVAIDLDHCVEDGVIADWAQDIIDQLDSYTEFSPSGTGIRILLCGELPPGRRKRGNVEVYATSRYVTVTGNVVDGRDLIEERTKQLATFHDRHFPKAGPPSVVTTQALGSPPRQDDTDICEMVTANEGEEFTRLHNGDDTHHDGDESAADFVFCKMLARRTQDPAQVDRIFRESGRMRPKWDERRGETTYGEMTVRNTFDAVIDEASADDEALIGVDGYRYSTRGNALRLIELHGHLIIYIAEWRKWFVYVGGVWRLDHDNTHLGHMAQNIGGHLLSHRSKAVGRDQRKALARWALRSEQDPTPTLTLTAAKRFPEVNHAHEEFDANPLLLNVRNGTVDLRTCELRQHNRDDLQTLQANVNYDPDIASPLWDDFLERFLPDPEVRRFLQRLVGTVLVGEQVEHLLPILYGDGANGKSTLTGVVARVLGDYSVSVTEDLFLAIKSDRHPTQRASLFRRRFAHSGELPDQAKLDEALIKKLTGGDRISARRMNEDPWEFDPSHTLWLHSNHKPTIVGTDHGIWRRVLLIPFDVKIPDDEKVNSFDKKIVGAEASGVLNWMLAGLADYRANGLSVPQAVQVVNERYRLQSDTVAQFIAGSRLAWRHGLSVSTAQLRTLHYEWHAESGVADNVEVHYQRVVEALRERGATQGKSKGQRFWRGIGLQQSFDVSGRADAQE